MKGHLHHGGCFCSGKSSRTYAGWLSEMKQEHFNMNIPVGHREYSSQSTCASHLPKRGLSFISIPPAYLSVIKFGADFISRSHILERIRVTKIRRETEIALVCELVSPFVLRLSSLKLAHRFVWRFLSVFGARFAVDSHISQRLRNFTDAGTFVRTLVH